MGPYRLYFYSHEPNEPPHIHIGERVKDVRLAEDTISVDLMDGRTTNSQWVVRLSANRPCRLRAV